jgi:hypothetical protein
MKKDLPPNTIATMSHGRVTVQAWWVEGVRQYRALAWGVNGEEVDTRKLDPEHVPAHVTLVGLWAMTNPKDGTPGHVKLPWRLTDRGKAMAPKCPCGPCTWEDPPVRQRRAPTPKKTVTAEDRRRARRAKARTIYEILEAQARRIRELELELSEQKRLQEQRFARLLAEARAECELRERAAEEREHALRDRLKAQRGAGGQFIKAGAPAPTAEELHEKRVKAGKASGAARRAKRASPAT